MGETAGFYMCECRLRRNFFVRSVEEHFEYDGDDAAFARQYAEVVRERGANAKLPPMEEVLADVRAQREARAKMPAEAQERAQLIASRYQRLHPEVYRLDRERFLAPGFRELVVELRGCPDRPRAIDECVLRLSSLGVLSRLGEGLWTFPVFTQDFCDLFEAELAHFEASDLPKARPNTMNRFGTLLRELGFCEELLDPLVAEFVEPLAVRLLPRYTEALDSYRPFTVRYEAQDGADRHLNLHYDNAEVTLNVNFGGSWTGGEVTFCGVAGQPGGQAPIPVVLRRGYGVLHAGRELHQAEPVTAGKRQNLILWCRSSGVRNAECPMCFQPPVVLPTNVFAHEGFTVPPCRLSSS